MSVKSEQSSDLSEIVKEALNEKLLDIAADIELETLWPNQNMHKTDALLTVVRALREAVS
jgi:hypothetical protein